MDTSEHVLEQAIIDELRHHLAGWRTKINNDFSEDSYNRELEALRGDSLYPKFSLDRGAYVNIRFLGRMSISIGRRLGEIYDKIPRRLAIEKYGLTPIQVSPKIAKLELDVGLRFSEISSDDDVEFIASVYTEYFNSNIDTDGLGIEIRYNFNPNDSSRLRKDVAMAQGLIEDNLQPVYLVFSAISPRQEAIRRLERAGWKFLIGQDALDFATEIFGLDIASVLDRPAIKEEIEREMEAMMDDIKTSHSFSQF